jgi:hypothetical protein
MTNECQKLFKFKKMFFCHCVQSMQHKRFEQPLIYLQDDVGDKIVNLKGLAKFSFQIDS